MTTSNKISKYELANAITVLVGQLETEAGQNKLGVKSKYVNPILAALDLLIRKAVPLLITRTPSPDLDYKETVELANGIYDTEFLDSCRRFLEANAMLTTDISMEQLVKEMGDLKLTGQEVPLKFE